MRKITSVRVPWFTCSPSKRIDLGLRQRLAEKASGHWTVLRAAIGPGGWRPQPKSRRRRRHAGRRRPTWQPVRPCHAPSSRRAESFSASTARGAGAHRVLVTGNGNAGTGGHDGTMTHDNPLEQQKLDQAMAANGRKISDSKIATPLTLMAMPAYRRNRASETIGRQPAAATRREASGHFMRLPRFSGSGCCEFSRTGNYRSNE